MLGRLYRRLLDFIRSVDLFTFVLWGVRIHRKRMPVTWDLTSITLKKALDRLSPATPFWFLDMGCGQICLLGQYVKRRWPQVRVCAKDLYDDLVECARFNAIRNGLDIEIGQSDLFEHVDGRFDLISFNPPYVPDRGQETLEFPQVRFSGPDGTLAMQRFLAQAHEYLSQGGEILLGVNCFFVPETVCRELISSAGYEIDGVVRRRFNSARVFVLHAPVQGPRGAASR